MMNVHDLSWILDQSECHNCHDICTETVNHCPQMGGDHAEPSHIRLLLDDAEICQTSANFMLHMSEFHGQICGVCADVCQRCAEGCGTIIASQPAEIDQMKAKLSELAE